MPFQGFFPETFVFLKNLAENNNKRWFDANRLIYETYVLKPLAALVGELSPFMLSIDPSFEVTPAVNKTISRIYRDTRFSEDKSPFRSNMWIVFKRPGRNWKDAPGYFFEIFPEWYRYGMGYYSASPATMASFRKSIEQNKYKFLEAVSFYHETDIYQLHGDKYKKIFDETQSEDLLDWVQRKTFYLSHNASVDERLFSGCLVDDLISHLSITTPLYEFLSKNLHG